MPDDAPQVEYGYVKLAYMLFWSLGHAKLTKYERLVVNCILHYTYGKGKKTAPITTAQFKQYCVIPSSNIYKAISRLKKNNVIFTIHSDSKRAVTYGINKRFKSWSNLSPEIVRLSTQIALTIQLDSSLPYINKYINNNKGKSDKSKPPDKPPDPPTDYQPVDKTPYQEIIEYLNNKTGKNFRHQTQAYRKSIHARFADGYNLEDFKTVINNKVDSWAGTEYEKYLTPDTLFRPSKFDKYLNERSPKRPKTDREKFLEAY